MPHAKINSKWIGDLNRRTPNHKTLSIKPGINLRDLGFGNGFLDIQKSKNGQTEFHQN